MIETQSAKFSQGPDRGTLTSWKGRWGRPRRSCYFQGRQLNPNKLTVRRLHQSFAECQIRTSRAASRRSIIRRGTASSSSSRGENRCIFRRYAELGSVRLLMDELEVRSVSSKSWASAPGRLWGGKPFARCALPNAAEPHLSRRDRSQEIVVSWRTLTDHRSVVLGCGSGPACRLRRATPNDRGAAAATS